MRWGPVSVVWRPWHLLVAGGLAMTAGTLLVLALTGGQARTSVDTVLAVLAGGGTDAEHLVVWQLRAPRAMTAGLVGVALGVAGALTQTVTRNPLATPDVLGVTMGASAAAVGVLVLGSGSMAGVALWVGLPAAALAGAVLTALAVWALAWRGGPDPVRLVLVGIVTGSALAAVVSWLLLRADLAELAAASVWLTGSVANRSWEHVVPLALTLVVVGIALAGGGLTRSVLCLDPDSARALGLRLARAQLAALGAAVALAAAATAAAGPIAFVALVAPQVAQRLVRAAVPPVLIAGLLGGVLVLAADLVAHRALPVGLPVGVLTAILGAPYLLLLLARATRRADL
jgi:iron complex transport system permease protein